jgi:hypothetical protein
MKPLKVLVAQSTNRQWLQVKQLRGRRELLRQD